MRSDWKSELFNFRKHFYVYYLEGRNGAKKKVGNSRILENKWKKLRGVWIDEIEAIRSVRKKAKKRWKEAKYLNPEVVTELPTLLNVYIAMWLLTF